MKCTRCFIVKPITGAHIAVSDRRVTSQWIDWHAFDIRAQWEPRCADVGRVARCIRRACHLIDKVVKRRIGRVLLSVQLEL